MDVAHSSATLHVASALKHVPRKEVVISTKTSGESGEEAKKSLEDSLKELDTDYVDIFLLHYVTHDWIDSCHQVLKELKDVKTTGIVKAVGLSTHSVAVVREVAQFEELDVIMTICCKADQALINKFRDHILLEDGSIEEMFHAIKLAHKNGKGIIAMKVLGSAAPPLVKNYQSSIKKNGKRIQRVIKQLAKDGYIILHKKDTTISLNPTRSKEIIEYTKRVLEI